MTWDNAVVLVQPFSQLSAFSHRSHTSPSPTPIATQLYMDAINTDLHIKCPCGNCDLRTALEINLNDGVPPSPDTALPSDKSQDTLGYKSKTITVSTYSSTDLLQIAQS